MDKPGINAIDPEQEKLLTARWAFKGFLDTVGCDVVEVALNEAEENQNRGHKGITIPTEDHLFSLAIDDRGVSFRAGDLGPYIVPTDTAKVAIAEVRAEQAQQNK